MSNLLSYIGLNRYPYHTDFDLCPATDTLNALARASGISVNDLAGMSYASDLSLFEENQSAHWRSSRFVVSLGTRRAAHNEVRGTPFCPECLEEDTVPYLRKSWRYSFVTVCIRHRVQLSEVCKNCGSTISSRSLRLREPSIHESLAICWRCKASLADQPSNPASRDTIDLVASLQHRLIASLKDRWFVLGGKPIYSVALFSGMSTILRLIISSHDVGSEFRACCSLFGLPFDMKDFEQSLTKRYSQYVGEKGKGNLRSDHAFEHFGVGNRIQCMVILAMLFKVWPSRLQIALSTNLFINSFHRRVMFCNTPFWLFEAIGPVIPDWSPQQSIESYSVARQQLAAKGYTRPTDSELRAFIEYRTLPAMDDIDYQLLKQARSKMTRAEQLIDSLFMPKIPDEKKSRTITTRRVPRKAVTADQAAPASPAKHRSEPNDPES